MYQTSCMNTTISHDHASQLIVEYIRVIVLCNGCIHHLLCDLTVYIQHGWCLNKGHHSNTDAAGEMNCVVSYHMAYVAIGGCDFDMILIKVL